MASAIRELFLGKRKEGGYKIKTIRSEGQEHDHGNAKRNLPVRGFHKGLKKGSLERSEGRLSNQTGEVKEQLGSLLPGTLRVTPQLAKTRDEPRSTEDGHEHLIRVKQ